MYGIINIEVDINPQDVYNELYAREQREFLLNNFGDLDDEDLIRELETRGYSTVEIQK